MPLNLGGAAPTKSLQSCPTLCDPIDGSPPGFPIPRILQARTLEWVAISFSNAWKWKVQVKSLSRVRHLATPWTVAYQDPPSMGFSKQEYWSGVSLWYLIAVLICTSFAISRSRNLLKSNDHLIFTMKSMNKLLMWCCFFLYWFGRTVYEIMTLILCLSI